MHRAHAADAVLPPASEFPLQAVVLVGGKGTRIRSQSPGVPKALIPVAGQPFLERQIEWLYAGGIRAVHLATGHLAEAIEAWLQTFSLPGLRVTASREPTPLDTAGALRFAAPYWQTDPLLALNGDSLLPNLNFHAFLHAHRAMQAPATLAVTRIEEAGRYGTVAFDDTRWILAFREKAERDGGWVNGGVYILSRAILQELSPGRPCSLERDLFPRLVAARQVGAFPVPPPLLDMGTQEGLRHISAYFGSDASNPS